MGRAKKRTSTARELTAAERRQLLDVLAGAHAELELWRKCENRACQRNRACGVDVDACGARYAPQAWAWVHEVLRAMRAGRSQRAALRAADGVVHRQQRLTIEFGFGEPAEFVVNDDGTWTLVDGPRVPSELDLQLERLTGSGWLRAAARSGCKSSASYRGEPPAG
jgi:hypothetical protein